MDINLRNSTTDRRQPFDFTRVCDSDECQLFPNRCDHVSSAAVCVQCGALAPVCCDDGYADLHDGAVEHIDPVCVNCCGPHARHHGGDYQRADCDQ